MLISKEIKSIKTFKCVFMIAVMLRHYEFDDESMIKINVSNFVIVEMFFRLDEIVAQWHLIAFFFKKKIVSKRNYEVDEQEILAIIKVCKKWWHYVKDFKHCVRMIIDYVNFKNFFTNKNLSRREIRWWERLTKYNLKIEYRFDKNNLVDDLSRRRDYEDQTLKKDKNEHLNLRKWTLIESSTSLKNKKKRLFLCRVETDTSFCWI